jgi:hypothetical protein
MSCGAKRHNSSSGVLDYFGGQSLPRRFWVLYAHVIQLQKRHSLPEAQLRIQISTALQIDILDRSIPQ